MWTEASYYQHGGKIHIAKTSNHNYLFIRILNLKMSQKDSRLFILMTIMKDLVILWIIACIHTD